MKRLRTGYTTGACAAAAAKAAARFLAEKERATEVEISLPEGTRVTFPVEYVRIGRNGTQAAVRKDAGDDPDVTNGALLVVEISPIPPDTVIFAAGEGVGTVTKPGLSMMPGEAAVNPVPRRMIENAVREVTPQGLLVTVSIPGGRKMAEKTFNPRLGINGGLSVLGTTGIVRPYSVSAVHASLKCSLDVAAACGIEAPILVPGNIGRRAAQKNFRTKDQQIIEVGNEWGFIIDSVLSYRFGKLLVAGHPGKLVKLAAGHWDTHSARSDRAVTFVARRAEKLFGRSFSGEVTVEGIFASLPAHEIGTLGNILAGEVQKAVAARMAEHRGTIAAPAIALTDMQGRILGSAGDIAPWR